MNGWRVPRGGTVTLVYTPATLARPALLVLPFAAVSALGWMYAGRRWRGWQLRTARRVPYLRRLPGVRRRTGPVRWPWQWVARWWRRRRSR